MQKNRLKIFASIAALLATMFTHVAQAAAPSAKEIASWHGPYGWDWYQIPAGTPIRILIKLELPTYLYRERKDGTSFATLAEGQLGEYLGVTKDGWVQIHTKQGTGWVDYRLLEPVPSGN